MMPTARKELIQSIIVNTMIGLVTFIAAYFIPNEGIRTVVIIFFLMAIVVISLIPEARRHIRSWMNLEFSKKINEQNHIHHHLIHQVRDMCLEMMLEATYTTPILVAGQLPSPHSSLQKNRDKIISLLERVAQLFQLFVPPGTRVWACIRDRRSDDCYYTFARAGRYNANRSTTSKPMHKDNSQTIQRLKDSMKFSGICVIRTGSSMGPQMWESQINDGYAEDKSVLLGAIMTKSWDKNKGDWSNRKLAWIIGVCADQEHAFDEMHIPLMQSCVDMFSMLANVIIRSSP
jgi:hypothetical protein